MSIPMVVARFWPVQLIAVNFQPLTAASLNVYEAEATPENDCSRRLCSKA